MAPPFLSELLIPWSQAQQLRLAAVLDDFIDQSSPTTNFAEVSIDGDSVASLSAWSNLYRGLCAEHRWLTIAACLVAQRTRPDLVRPTLVYPVPPDTSDMIVPIESQSLRRIRRAWWIGLRQTLSGPVQIQDPSDESIADWMARHDAEALFGQVECHSTVATPHSELMYCWEQVQNLRNLPPRVALSVAAGDAADPRYACLQRSLLHRIDLVLQAETFEDRVQREKLASLKRLAYGASHEINNPLANIATRAQTLLREETHLQRRQSLETINAQAFRAFDMLANLMHYAAPPSAKPQSVDLVPLTKRCLADVHAHWQGALEPQWRSSNDRIEAMVDPQQVAVLIQALLRNAWEACGPQGQVVLAVEEIASPVESTEWIAIRVQDNGPAFPAASLASMCDPFHSGREAGRGLGFGLAKSLRIVEAHHGWLMFTPQEPHGLAVTAYLPRHGAGPGAPSPDSWAKSDEPKSPSP